LASALHAGLDLVGDSIFWKTFGQDRSQEPRWDLQVKSASSTVLPVNFQTHPALLKRMKDRLLLLFGDSLTGIDHAEDK
jgi:hypothetical protein